jgi:type I restriction enzyme S subunit
VIEKQRSEVRGQRSEEEIESSSLPKGWELAVISELIPSEGIFVDGDWIESKDQDPDGEVRLIQLADIGDGNFRDKSSRFLTIDRAKALKCTFLRQDDILVARMPDPIGRACLFPLRKEKSFVTAVDVAIIRLGEGFVFPRYLMHCINNPRLRQEIENLQSGTTRKRISRNNLATISFPIPPVSEQHRIVARIEELFSDLDKGIENLKAAQQQLKIYRQAVLKSAFDGKLTNKNVVDGELPEGWTWVKIDFFLSGEKKGMATGPFGMMLKKNEQQNSGVPVLGIENIGEGVFQMPNKVFVTNEKAEELNSFRVEANDVIISRSGTVGEICLVPEKMRGSIISTNLIKVSINQEVLNPKYFVYLFQGGKVRQQVFNLCKGSSRAFLNQTILKSLEETIELSLKQAESLRQSILKKAFEGKLVPQDPNDEPASELLARIRAEHVLRDACPGNSRKAQRSRQASLVAKNATVAPIKKHKRNSV